MNRIFIALLLFIALAADASSQGYMGTITTGTGIVPPLVVGKASTSTSNVGGLSSLANLTGSWSVDLKGAQIKHFDLQIFQERDLIAGTGTMSGDGSSLNVTVAGSISGSRPTIFISRVGEPEVFRLALSASGTSLAGSYDAISRERVREAGTTTGSMILFARQNQPTALSEGINPAATSFGGI